MRAVVHRIDHDIDATALADYAILWLHDGFSLAALGQACTIEVPANERATAADRAETVLASIECDGDIDAYGTGPLAFAALPFATERAATIVVPEVIYGRDLGGTRWITWIGDGPELGRMRELTTKLGLTRCVAFPGFEGNRSILLKAMRDSDILLFCHKTTESARCLIEATVSGCALVGYDTAYPRGLTEDCGGAILTPQGDPIALAESLQALHFDRTRLVETITAAALTGKLYNEDSVYRRRAELMIRAS